MPRWLISGTAGGLKGNADELEWKWVDFSTMPERPLDLNSTPDRSYNKENLVWNTAIWNAPSIADKAGGSAPAAKPGLAAATNPRSAKRPATKSASVSAPASETTVAGGRK